VDRSALLASHQEIPHGIRRSIFYTAMQVKQCAETALLYQLLRHPFKNLSPNYGVFYG